MPKSVNVVKVGNHWGSRTAEWAVENREPDAGDPGVVAVSGLTAAAPVEVEVESVPSKSPVSRGANAKESRNSDGGSANG